VELVELCEIPPVAWVSTLPQGGAKLRPYAFYTPETVSTFKKREF